MKLTPSIQSFKLLFCLLLMLAACKHETTEQYIAPLFTPPGQVISNQYIILFEDNLVDLSKLNSADVQRAQRPSVGETRKQIVKDRILEIVSPMGIRPDAIIDVYAELMIGFSAVLDNNQLTQLRNHPNVKQIEQDMIVNLPETTLEYQNVGLRAQSTPCGITNAGGSADGSASSKWIWIVDTGIDLDHPDLNVETGSQYAKSFVKGSKSADDCHGHGTHCSGIAAAKNNDIGVVGVSAGARVVPVRVLNCQGSGTTSAILSGLNHVAANDEPGDVVNLSLGGYWGANCDANSSYSAALKNMSAAGTRIAIASGNSAANAALYTPACANATNIHTTASMTCAKAWSSFSNYGVPPVDWIATGSSVYSTYKDGTYATLSGTSMAAPHVAGIMHNIQASPNQNGTVTYNNIDYKIAVR
ncbi:MAG: S8 family serine peptidase [Saprospiraceae bacterium]|nr:S8 family serine peptidase [Candidatus Vicinibacter proximus]MCC6843389.1 S8 family serine peptidase [Saprospiraceae bacterium]